MSLDVSHWVLLLVAIYFAGVYWWERHANESLNRSWQAEKALRIEDDKLRREAQEELRELEVENTHLRKAMNALADGLDQNVRVLSAQAKVNEQIVKERDETFIDAQRQNILFGNGQNMLFRQLGDLLREYNGYRKEHGDPPRVMDPGIQQVMKERETV